MRFQLSEVPRVDNGQYVRASDYEALELAYVKLRHDLLEIMDNDGTNHAYKGEHIEHMLAYQGLRVSVISSWQRDSCPRWHQMTSPTLLPFKGFARSQTYLLG
jgi:hypothetical protein